MSSETLDCEEMVPLNEISYRDAEFNSIMRVTLDANGLVLVNFAYALRDLRVGYTTHPGPISIPRHSRPLQEAWNTNRVGANFRPDYAFTWPATQPFVRHPNMFRLYPPQS